MLSFEQYIKFTNPLSEVHKTCLQRILPKDKKDLLRNDFSVNIHLARSKVYESICKAIGEVRDKDLEFAESILINEAPVIPLVAEKNCALKKKTLKIDLNNEFADFKKAIFSN